MEDDWESVTKIGSKVRGGGASRQTVVRGSSQLNAAARDGSIIETNRKFASSNKAGADGQRLAKIDRTDDVVGLASVPLEIKDVVRREREARGLSQADLAKLCDKAAPLIRDLENVNARTQPQQDVLDAVENVLNVRLRGKAIGQPKNIKRKQREDGERAAQKAAELAAQAELDARQAKKDAKEKAERDQLEGGPVDANAEGVDTKGVDAKGV